MNDELPERLRSAGDDFSPDRDRMWSRVSDGMREPRQAAERRPQWRMPLAALAAGAAVVLIGGVVLLGQAIGLGPVISPSPEPPAAGPGTRSAEASETATDPGSSEAGVPSSAEITESATGTETGEAPEQDPRWITVDSGIDSNSNAYWSQVNLVFANSEPLTRLDVELRVAIGDGINSLGTWNTDNNLFSEGTESEEDGFMVYRWTLKDGATLPPGSYTLAAQFSHDQGPRSADEDSYRFDAATETESGRVEGGI
ncbi:hypothetical protein AB0B28_15900 [Glycomyces sp. NPDC046736]|uniref:hypothetical protein n=1 Tax=Glycomyces sp. NPDC046736 TaxID=3155615 RepID=UPI00340E9072